MRSPSTDEGGPSKPLTAPRLLTLLHDARHEARGWKLMSLMGLTWSLTVVQIGISPAEVRAREVSTTLMAPSADPEAKKLPSGAKAAQRGGSLCATVCTTW